MDYYVQYELIFLPNWWLSKQKNKNENYREQRDSVEIVVRSEVCLSTRMEEGGRGVTATQAG